MTKLEKEGIQVEIQEGELCGLTKDGVQYMHKASEPGWNHSDIEMFPIIGPTEEAGYQVQVNKGYAFQDQHGLLREMRYVREAFNGHSAVYKKTYTANSVIENSKYPKRSPQARLIWPYTFEMTKSFYVKEGGLTIEFTIRGDRDMPYMLGYHPAFRIEGPDAVIRSGDQSIRIPEVMDVGSRAMLLPDTNEVVLEDAKTLQLTTSGFRHFMLWTEVPGMVCIEPITFYPYAVSPAELHKGFDYLGDQPVQFCITLKPL